LTFLVLAATLAAAAGTGGLLRPAAARAAEVQRSGAPGEAPAESAAGERPRDGDDWPQWRGPHRDGVWRESGVVDSLPAELDYRWRTPIGGGFAGPAVVADRVYVTDRVLPPGVSNPENRWNRTDPVDGSERVLCLDAATGRIVWSHQYPCRYEISYPAGPRATPTVHAGKVYTLGAMGDLLCLEADTGRVVWSRNYVTDFGTRMNLWGMAAAPLIDGDRLILLAGGRDGGCVLALDKDDGRELWRALDADDPGYSAPAIIHFGGVRQLIVWNPVGLHSLDPDSGRLYWSQPFETRMGHSVASPVFDAKRGLLLVSSFFHGSLMMQLDDRRPAARLLWKGTSDSELPQSTDGLHALMCTPVLQDGYVYGICSYGRLRCLEASTGRRLWGTYAATPEGRWSNAFLIQHQDRFFLCNEQGQLMIARLSPRGYDEISRAKLIEPTNTAGRRQVVWSHPAFAGRCVYARNDKEIVCVDLSRPAGR
jgi:outer membrane protein assembly factor BamB